jgi:hypothetical protein
LAFEYVPSVHFAVAPVGPVLPDAGLAVVLAPSAVAAGALAAVALDDEAALELVAGADFCTPPWPLQAPRPVAVEVVPSLHVVGAGESAAQAAWLQARISNGTAAMRASA